jgi:hypothetical protein
MTVRLTDAQLVELERRYRAGETLLDLSRYYLVHPKGVRLRLVRRGVEIRPSIKPRKKGRREPTARRNGRDQEKLRVWRLAYAQSEAGKAAQRRYRERHPTRTRAARLKWQAKNPDYFMLRAYGITKLEWAEMFAAQKCRCAICGSDAPGSVKGWHTDHCHDTNKVRGILCYNCNTGLGKLGDSLARLRDAVAYLERAA